VTYQGIFDMLEEAGVPVAYYQFEEVPGGTTADHLTTERGEIVVNENGDPIPVRPAAEYEGVPEPPFICFYFPGSDDMMADNHNYVSIRPLTVELYTNDKDFAMEAKLEAIFRRYELPFTRTEAYVESERMFQITYSLEVLITDES